MVFKDNGVYSSFSIKGYILTDTIGKDYFFFRNLDGKDFLLHTKNLNKLFGATNTDEMNEVVSSLDNKIVTVSGEINLRRDRLVLYADEIKVPL